MPPGSEVLGNGTIRRQEPLSMARRFEPLHPILALTRRPMRVLTPVIEIPTLPMFYPRQDLPFGRAVALELIGDDDAGHVLQALEQLAEKLLGCFFVPTALHQDIEDVIVLVDSAPQIMGYTQDSYRNYR